MKKQIKILSVAVFTASILFTGCSKEEEKAADPVDPKVLTTPPFNVTIDENPVVGQVLGQLNATGEGGTVDYGPWGSVPANGVAISSTGQVSVADPSYFDYELNTVVITKAVVRVNGQGSTETPLDITITLNDVAEIPPLTIQQRLDTGETPAQIIASGVDKADLYGKLYGGGIIFYYSLFSNTGLLAAPTDQSVSLAWDFNTSGLVATGAISIIVGEGAVNTSTIVSVLGAGSYAAQVCDDLTLTGYTDWFLPSKDVLGFMYTELHAKGLGSFQNTKYWSSTEFNANGAWTRDFAVSSGQTFVTETKVVAHGVRAIRAF